MLEPITLTAPSSWASFLINGDDSGILNEDRSAVIDWVERQGLGWPVSCDDFGWSRWHDAWEEFPYFTDCQTYTFLVSRA